MTGVHQQLATIRGARQAIEMATSMDDLRVPLLAIVGLLERSAEGEVVDADLILGRRKPSDTHPG